MSKETEKFIDDHSQKWILAPEESVELVASLDDALKSQNPDEVREILKDPQKLRRMILDRRKVDGKAGKNLVVLCDSFDFMFAHSFKDKDFYSVESGDIVKWMKNEGLPEYLLNEMMATAFYLHDDRKFFRLSSIISENKDKFEDKTIFLRAMHDLASWESTAEGGTDTALNYNQVVLASMGDVEDEILKTKARFGQTYNKRLRPKDKIEDFECYRKKFLENGDEYDAVQAMNEATKAYLELSKLQNQPQAKEESLGKAEKIGLEALTKAEELNYSNALYKANLFLSRIYEEMKDRVKAKFYLTESNKLKRETGYRYSKNV